MYKLTAARDSDRALLRFLSVPPCEKDGASARYNKRFKTLDGKTPNPKGSYKSRVLHFRNPLVSATREALKSPISSLENPSFDAATVQFP